MEKTMSTIFYGGSEIRTTVIDGETWWAIVDVCKIIEIKNNHDVAKKLDEDEKAEVDLIYPSSNGIEQRRKITMVNEPGLYHILLTSRSEKAKKFRRWVTHDVLPRIRKYGYYKLNNDERKFVAYKEIAESLNTNVNDLDDSYAKMPRYRLEAEARRLKYEAKQEEEKENTIKDYPYSYDEMDALCDYDLEYVKTFIANGEEDRYYKRISNGEEWYSEKFKREIPKFKAKWYNLCKGV